MRLPHCLIALIHTLLIHTAGADDIRSSFNASLLWGPYRPNTYLGIRPRIPDSIIAGLMWGKFEDVEKTLRHNVNTSDGMSKYEWTAYDPRSGGQQIIEDVENNIDITTDFVKPSDRQETGNWGLRVRGTPRNGAPAGLKTTLVFYVGMENMEACSECKLEAREQSGDGEDTAIQAVNVQITHPTLGSADMHIPSPQNSHGEKGEMVVKSLNVTEGNLWKAKSVFLNTLRNHMVEGAEAGSIDLVLRNGPDAGNMHFVQMACRGTFEFDVLYSSRSEARAMTSELPRSLESSIKTFRRNFAKVFGTETPFKTEQHLRFSETIFSNLLGGLGYFHGTTKVDTSKKAIYAETTSKFWEISEDAKLHAIPEVKGPYGLLTFTPSRATFPRGFLWDEGFHLLPVIEWDADLALEVLRNWLALMDDDGWIAREQILGVESEDATPSDFVTQYPHIANPPTLFLVVAKFVDLLAGTTRYYGRKSMYLAQPETGRALFSELYMRMQKHYEWFRISQSGDVEVHAVPSANLNEGYRWRGRTPDTGYSSGLDDYPRAEPPDVSELHLDALCWVGVMANTLEQVASFMKSTRDISTYQNHARNVKKNIDAIHWDEKQNIYCDTVVRNDKHTFACHKGYLSLFPFLTGLLDSRHPHLSAILDLLHDPKQLWTVHGIRSLSPDDKKYGVGYNYWRSPIWINMNYLALTQLLRLARTPGPSRQRCREIYAELRSNIVHTVYSSWVETGFVWEQYDPVAGKGQRTQQFTGWTALIAKIMAMPNLGPSEAVKEKVGDVYEEVKKQAVQHPKTSGAGSAALMALLVVFLFVTRRRFAGTLRSVRSRGLRA